jgi:hypothetical protein
MTETSFLDSTSFSSIGAGKTDKQLTTNVCSFFHGRTSPLSCPNIDLFERHVDGERVAHRRYSPTIDVSRATSVESSTLPELELELATRNTYEHLLDTKFDNDEYRV